MSMTSRKKRQNRLVQKRLNISLAIGLLVLFVCFAVYFVSQIRLVQREILYPFPYQEIVERYAKQYHVDRSLCVAVVKVESKFRHDAVSHRGALGLMQIMPDTGRFIAGQLDEDFSVEKLREPETNIRYGIWYLSTLEQEFEGNDVLALAAYNAGRGNVHAWMNEMRWSMNFTHIDSIPFRETREYVQKVLKSQAKYKELYDEQEVKDNKLRLPNEHE